MRRFFVYYITKNYCIELDFFKSFISLGWFAILNYTMDIRLKGSHKGFYWSFYLLGFKIFEINIYNKNHDQDRVYHPIIDY